MTPAELQIELARSGIPARVNRAEVAIQLCVFCSNPKWNLELNAEKGVYHSWCCKRSGRLDKLLRELTGQEYRIRVQDVTADKAARQLVPAYSKTFASTPIADGTMASNYLGARGISAAVARNYGLVVVTEPEHLLCGRIAIPAREYWTGALVGWQGRTYTAQQPKYLSTMERKVVTGWRQREHDAVVVIVEGPMDGIAVHRAGYSAAVLSGLASVGGEGIEEWAARVPEGVKIVVMFDGEGQAQEQARRLFWRISAVRAAPVIVAPPEGEDPSSLGPERVRALVEGAVRQGSGT